MPALHTDRRFLLYQIRAIRRFQRLREPTTREDAQRLALEWIHRFADRARQRWTDHILGNVPLERATWKI